MSQLPTFHDLKQVLFLLYAGGTMVNVLEDIVSRGGDPSNIIVVCVVAAPPALKKLSEKFVGECAPSLLRAPPKCRIHICGAALQWSLTCPLSIGNTPECTYHHLCIT